MGRLFFRDGGAAGATEPSVPLRTGWGCRAIGDGVGAHVQQQRRQRRRQQQQLSYREDCPVADESVDVGDGQLDNPGVLRLLAAPQEGLQDVRGGGNADRVVILAGRRDASEAQQRPLGSLGSSSSSDNNSSYARHGT